MSSENSRKSFLLAIAAVVAGVIALPKLLAGGQAKDSANKSSAKFNLRQDPRSVNREDSRFV